MIDDVEQYYFNNIRLKSGEQILNVNRSIKDVYDFTKYVESIYQKKANNIYLWVRYTEKTHLIFEQLLPILSDWNKFDKSRFMKNGTILVSSEKLVPGYPVGVHPQTEVCNHTALDIVVCDDLKITLSTVNETACRQKRRDI